MITRQGGSGYTAAALEQSSGVVSLQLQLPLSHGDEGDDVSPSAAGRRRRRYRHRAQPTVTDRDTAPNGTSEASLCALCTVIK